MGEKGAVTGAWYADRSRLTLAGMKDDALLWCAKVNTHRQLEGGEVRGTPSISCIFT